MTDEQIVVLVLLTLVNLAIIIVLLMLLNLDLRSLLSYVELAIFIFMIFGMFRLIRHGGKLKRGVPIWKEDLPKDIAQATRKMSFTGAFIENDYGLMRAEGSEILVIAIPQFFRTSWPCVGYINLDSQNPKIEYRTALGGLLILVPLLFGPGILFITVAMPINVLLMRRTILNFILKYANEEE